jgi:transcriptional regulator with XRE-family HTH domain
MKIAKSERIDFGKRLVEYLKSRNITQDELALQCGYSRQTINNFINGKSSASSEFLARMTNIYYDLNLNWLISGKGGMTNSDINDTVSYEPRMNYSIESLIELLDGKDQTIRALKETLKTKEEVISAQKELLKIRKKV